GGGAGRALRARLREHRRGILVGLRGDAPGDRSGSSDARQLRRKTPAGFHLRLGGHADDRPAELGERLHVNTRASRKGAPSYHNFEAGEGWRRCCAAEAKMSVPLASWACAKPI